MKWIFGQLFVLWSVYASAENLPAFVCDSCSSGDALTLAMEKAPPFQCEWSNSPGTFPEPGDEVCQGGVKTLAIINTVEQQAYKIRVESRAEEYNLRRVEANFVNFTSAELEVIQAFYEIDRDFQTASNNAVASVAAVRKFHRKAKDLKGLTGVLFAQTSMGCAEHPISFFTPTGEKAVLDSLTQYIASKISDSSWHEYWEASSPTGSGVTIGKGSVGFSVSFEHRQREAFAHYYYDDDNHLNFTVSYHGEVNIGGYRKLYLQYELLPSVSTINGILVGSLFRGDHAPLIDLSQINASACLIEFINNNSTPVLGGGTGEGDGDGIPGGDDGPRLCERRARASACSSGGCRYQMFTFFTAC